MVTETDDLVGGEIASHGGILPAERCADDALKVAGYVGYDELVFVGGLYLQAVVLVDGVDAEVVIPVSVGGKEMTGLESFTADILCEGLALVVVVGAAVDDDTLEGLIADDVGVLLK